MLRTVNAMGPLRGYATAAAAANAAAKTSPPVTPPGLAGKYAGALYSAALKSSSKTLSQVETDLNALRQLMKGTPTVASFLANPTLQHAEKQAGLADVVKRLGGSTSDYTKNFLNVLAENGRLYETEKVLDGFEQIMSAHRGELQVTVTSAEPLDKSTLDRLRKTLESSKTVKEAKTLKLHNRVQPDLLGGIVVDFGDEKSVDLSVKSKVQKLEQLISQSV